MVYECSHCAAQYAKWQGQCGECGKWGTIQKEDGQPGNYQEAKVKRAGAPGELKRFSVGAPEVENVLGGGLVPGSLTLLAGDPGIGKSTLALQIVGSFSRKNSGEVLYAAGEESPDQIGMRMSRLNVSDEVVRFTTNTNINSVISAIKKRRSALVVIDSIQTMSDESVNSTPPSANQIRAVCARLLEAAKQTGIPVLAIGHITKEGSFAGPQTLAHMVDTVLYLEGDKVQQYRLLRCVKNRFGPTNQVGVFTMENEGLREVKNPSELFLSEHKEKTPGSVVSVIMEGTRPFLIEIQSLTNRTSYGYPKRAASGFDLSRMELLLAVLQRRGGLKLSNQDVFLNVVGGLRTRDTALDLAAALAIASSLSGQSMPEKSIAIGEIGLAGEVRPVPFQDDRLREAGRLGFKNFYTHEKARDICSSLALLGIKK